MTFPPTDKPAIVHHGYRAKCVPGRAHVIKPEFTASDPLSRQIFQGSKPDNILPPAETLFSLRAEVAALQKQNARLQQSLRLSSGLRQRFETLYDGSPLGLISLDSDDQIIEANLTLAELLQVKRSQLIGQHVGNLIAPADHASFIHHLAELRDNPAHTQADAHCTVNLINTQQNNIRVKLESSWQHAGSYSIATIHIRIFPLESKHLPQYQADLQKEIAERKLAEEQTRQHQEKLAHVARLNTMGEMASGLAHELNQPLTAIRSYTQSCLRLLDGSPEKQLQVPKILALVNVQAKRAASIIKHLRDFVSKSASHRETTQLTDIVQQALRMMAHEFREQNIELEVETAPNLPTVHADAIQLEQVVLNLLRNACDAMRETTGTTRQLNIALERTSTHQVRIAICDTGPGISADAAQKIATPFFSTKDDGMGLGLAISRTIVEDHGGKLSHENNIQGGATFAFTLAINGQRPASVAENSAEVSPVIRD